MLKHLRIKFICINMAIIMVALSIIFGVLIHVTKLNIEYETIHMMQDIAEDPFYQEHSDELLDKSKLSIFVLEILSEKEINVVVERYYKAIDELFIKEVASAALLVDEQAGLLEKYDLRFCKMQTPKGMHIVFADVSNEQNIITELIKTSIIISAISFVIFLIISCFLAKWAVKPVEKAWTQQRQFVADASHELKTPLTVIMTNAELLQDETRGQSSCIQLSENILIMTHQMKGLVESLLGLARLDAGNINNMAAEVDFSKLVYDATLPFEPVYFEKGLTLKSEIESGIYVKGDEARLRQVTEVLLDNAQKYSAASGMIMITLKKQGRQYCLMTVSNSGEEIPKTELKNIFKRFYRIDKVRSRDGSYGLGLSIADEIVAGHHGKIWAESTNGINTFFVRLPVSSRSLS